MYKLLGMSHVIVPFQLVMTSKVYFTVLCSCISISSPLITASMGKLDISSLQCVVKSNELKYSKQPQGVYVASPYKAVVATARVLPLLLP